MTIVEELLEKIDGLTVVELSELVKGIEEKYGVSAVAAAAPAAGPAATATAAAAGSIPYSSLRIVASSLTSFTVKLTNCSAKAFKSAIFV
jgi:ribosomal protein L7/L12